MLQEQLENNIISICSIRLLAIQNFKIGAVKPSRAQARHIIAGAG
jgi:hypothetical protein